MCLWYGIGSLNTTNCSSLSRELRTASSRGRYGERRQRDPCLKHTYKNTTCWPATAYDVTTGANHSIKGRRKNTSSSSSSSMTGLSLFLREEGQPSASRGSRPMVAEARRGLNSWGSQAELADELEKGLSLSRSSAANEGERLDDDDAISLTSFDPAASALLGYAQEEQEMSKGEEAEAEPAQSSCPAYDELLEVMERATARLYLPWKRSKMAPRGKKKNEKK